MAYTEALRKKLYEDILEIVEKDMFVDSPALVPEVIADFLLHEVIEWEPWYREWVPEGTPDWADEYYRKFYLRDLRADYQNPRYRSLGTHILDLLDGQLESRDNEENIYKHIFERVVYWWDWVPVYFYYLAIEDYREGGVDEEDLLEDYYRTGEGDYDGRRNDPRVDEAWDWIRQEDK